MKSTQLQRVIDLMRKTGDRCLVFDSQSDEGMVLMSIDEYEKLLLNTGESLENLNEKEMMDKVNRDISAWRSFQEDNFEFEDSWNEEEAVDKDDLEYDKINENKYTDKIDEDENVYYEMPVEETPVVVPNIMSEEDIKRVVEEDEKNPTGIKGFFDEDIISQSPLLENKNLSDNKFEENLDDLLEDEESDFLPEPI